MADEVYRSSIAQGLFFVDNQPLSLENYPMFLAAYDGKYPRLLLKTGRQVSKCVSVDALINMGNGQLQAARDVRVGDRVIAMLNDGAHTGTARVTWVSPVSHKTGFRIQTRLGHVLEVAGTHPIRVWGTWTNASDLRVGDRVASVRAGGCFGTHVISLERIRLTAYLIGDGHIGKAEIGFTALPGVVLDEFKTDLAHIGVTYGVSSKTGTRAVSVRTHRAGPLRLWMINDGLMDKRSAEKAIPAWVFGLTRGDTGLFLNRLWATDGMVKFKQGKYVISYATNSNKLARGVQALLWKFGIPTRIAMYVPRIFRERNEHRPHYVVRVETRAGVSRFLTEVGALGKSAGVPLPSGCDNSNRDTYPIAVQDDILRAYGSTDRRGRDDGGLYTEALRRTLKYPPSRQKLAKYVEVLNDMPGHVDAEVKRLRAHVDTDLIWDEIVRIDPVAGMDCVDFTVEGTHNFCVDGVVTHNSTTIAACMIAEAIGVPGFKSYYVSPTKEQTSKFSHTRVAKILAYSPDLRKGFVGQESIDNVFLRMLRNGSEMAFTYALDDPDRARGFSSDRCCFDAQAQVLTRAGWKTVKDVSLTDEIADVDDAGFVRWHRPSQLVAFPYTGEMVTFRHAGMHLRVTGNHKMWVNHRVKTSTRYKTPDVWKFQSASSLVHGLDMGFKMTCACLMDDAAPSTITLPGSAIGYTTSRVALEIDARAYAAFMGWYLSEGNLTWRKTAGKRRNASAVITQNESRFSREIENCLGRCGFTYSKHTWRIESTGSLRNTYVVASAQVGQDVAPLGKSFDKYIPKQFFDHPTLLEPLLQALYQGDAAIPKGAPWQQGTLRTRSRRLADDVHRAWTLLGRSSVVHTRSLARRPGGPPLPLYEVQAYVDAYAVFWKSEFTTKQRVTVDATTNEPVYCFTVPHHRPIVRGGPDQRPVIAGQCFDEVQDILYEAVIPVIEESMANSKYQYSVYAGTPKTTENTIEFLWSQSSMTEWCMKCTGCGKHSFIDNVSTLGKMGPECANCRKALNPRSGQWVDMAKYAAKTGDEGAGIKGFHVSQAIMLENVPAAWPLGSSQWEAAVERWGKLLWKMNSPLYGDSKFLNECIGVSTSTGVRLLTKEALEALCDPRHEMTRLPLPLSKVGITATYAGVDWSGGGSEVKGSEGLFKSRTVLHIWGQTSDGRLKTMYYKIFPNGHAVGWIDEIADLCNAWGVAMIVGDAGEGALANAMLRVKLGDHRVVAVRYMAVSKPVDWNPNAMAFHVDRTTLIDNFARFLLHKQAIYPMLPQAKPAIDDILNVYEEVTTQGRKVWRHSPTMPDDCLHAQLFAWFAWRMLSRDLQFAI